MVHGAGSMVQGAWCREHGAGSMAHGAWRMVHGAESIEQRAGCP